MKLVISTLFLLGGGLLIGATYPQDAQAPTHQASSAEPIVESSNTEKPESKKTAAEPDPIVCKRVKTTGSRLSSGKKVCKSRSTWETVAKGQQEAIRDQKRRARRGS